MTLSRKKKSFLTCKIPSAIRAYKLLRSNLQKRAVMYMNEEISKDASHKFNSSEFVKALDMSENGALKLLRRLTELGFTSNPVEKTIYLYKNPNGTPLKSTMNHIHYYTKLYEFTAVISTFKSLFYKIESVTTKSYCILRNTLKNKIINKINTTDPAASLRRKEKRLELEFERKNKPVAIAYLKQKGISMQRIKEILFRFFDSPDPIEEKPSVLTFMTQPKIEEIAEDLEDVCQKMDGIGSQWRDNRKYWFSLIGKRKKLVEHLKVLLSPFFDYKKLADISNPAIMLAYE